jgi:hypothetical protein
MIKKHINIKNLFLKLISHSVVMYNENLIKKNFKKMLKIKLTSKMFKLRKKNKILFPQIHLSNTFLVNGEFLLKKKKKLVFIKLKKLYLKNQISILCKKRFISNYTGRGLMSN